MSDEENLEQGHRVVEGQADEEGSPQDAATSDSPTIEGGGLEGGITSVAQGVGEVAGEIVGDIVGDIICSILGD